MSLIEQIEAEVQILRIRMERDYTYSHTRNVCGRPGCQES